MSNNCIGVYLCCTPCTEGPDLKERMACHPGSVLECFSSRPTELGVDALGGDVDASMNVTLAQEVMVVGEQLHKPSQSEHGRRGVDIDEQNCL